MQAPFADRVEPLPPARSGPASRIPALGMAVALGIMLALLLVSSTRWIVWKESGLQLRAERELSGTLRDLGAGNGVTQPPESAVDPKAIADRFEPNDFQVQLAATVRSYSTRSRRSSVAAPPQGASAGDAVRQLTGKFGARPSLYANAIRLDCLNRIKMNRPTEENVFSPAARPTIPPSPYAPAPYAPSPEQISQFLRDCESGERLEPGNGYFPMMRAAGLLVAHRDDEALTELHRAASMTAWQPHYVDEIDGAWRLNLLTTGDRSAVQRMAVQAATLFPEYALLQQTARVSVAKAILAEQAGRREDGLRTRMDVARCGALMRSEAPSIIGNLVGIAITAIAVTRPGGAASPPGGRAGRVNFGVRVAQFTSYLRKIGAGREAGWYQNELKAGSAAKAASVSGLANSPASLNAVRRLALLWLGGIALYGNAFWLLVLGIAGTLYLRRWRARQAAGWEHEDPFVVLMGAACILIATALIAWNQGRAAFEYAQAVAAIGGFYGGSSGPYPQDSSVARAASALFVLILPVLLIVMAVIVAAARRRPMILSVARSLRAVGLTMAALLMVGYAYVVTQTSRREAEMNVALTGIIHHEGRFMATAVGSTWPPLKHD